jgi:hypothetical protein
MNRGEFAGQDLGWLAMASSSSLAFFRIVSQQFDVNYQLSPNPDNSRRSEFKKGIDALEGRRRRSETSISIRKNKKDEGIAKRRLALPPAMSVAINESAAMDGGARSDPMEAKTVYTVADIPSLKAKLSQPNIDDAALLEVIRGFRKMMSVEDNPPVDEVLESGVLPAFVQMLQLNDKPKIQFESAWALTNIASTEKTKAVVDAGAVPYLAQLLSSPSAELREQVRIARIGYDLNACR